MAAARHTATPGRTGLRAAPTARRSDTLLVKPRRSLLPAYQSCFVAGAGSWGSTLSLLPSHRWSSSEAGGLRVRTGAVEQEGTWETATRASELVDRLLQEIENTDGGSNISPEKREVVHAMLEELEEIGKTQMPRPLDDPLLFGNCEVSYAATGRKQDGAPAGGTFRDGIGKAIFFTRGVYQAVLPPDIVVNKVAFSLLGVIDGAVGLRGAVQEYGKGRDTAKILFERPCINFGNLHFRIGPVSDVVLTTTYMDERVRLGKGSRGSLFVFKRGGAADTAELDKMGMEKSSPWALATVLAFLAALAASGVALWQTQTIPGRIAAVGIAALLSGMAFVLKKGGQRGRGDANLLSELKD